MVRIFEDGQAANHLSRLQHAAAHRADDVLEAEPLSVRVVLLRARKLPQADGHHLHEAAFDSAGERRMPLHARHDHHGVGRMRFRIHEDLDPIVGRAKRYDVGATDDGAAHGLFGNPKMSEDFRLSLRSRSTMTSHRGKNKWRHRVSAPVLHDAVDDGRDIGDAAASNADGDASAGPKPRREVAAIELVARLYPDIANAEVREILANDEQAGWKHQASSGRLTLSFISNQ